MFGSNRLGVLNYFSNLETLLQNVNLPHQVYNCEEFGLPCVYKPANVIDLREKIGLSMTRAGKAVTAIGLCVSNLRSQFIPPMILFKRKHAFPGIIQSSSENGWINTKPCTEHIKYFLGHTNCSKKNPVLLDFEGPNSL